LYAKFEEEEEENKREKNLCTLNPFTTYDLHNGLNSSEAFLSKGNSLINCSKLRMFISTSPICVMEQ
jgi:hypothetical protein